MPVRPRIRSLAVAPAWREAYVCQQCRHASLAAATASATTPAPSLAQMTSGSPALMRHPVTQPPTYKPAEARKTQLHRQYQSLLRSSPLILIFQHNNLKATEWASIRRELSKALQKVDADLTSPPLADDTKLAVVQTGIFASALKIVEFWDPKFSSSDASPSSEEPPNSLSKDAWRFARTEAARLYKTNNAGHGLEALLSGPLALLTLPSVSPAHLKAAISILAPSTDIPAPKRKAMPSLYEAPVQNGLQKLMLLGARIDGQAFDADGVKWVGKIEGGLDGLRATLVAMLQGFGANLTNTLQSASRNLYVTVESRRIMLDDAEKGDEKAASKEA